jgi:hypothetical protein
MRAAGHDPDDTTTDVTTVRSIGVETRSGGEPAADSVDSDSIDELRSLVNLLLP